MSNSITNILRLGMQNVVRWRWRLLTIAVLIALAFSLFLLYDSLIISSTASGIASIDPIDTRYYDMLIRLEAGQSIVAPEELPRPQYGRELMDAQEGAALLTVASEYGDFSLLGLQPASPFFAIPAADLQGRLAQSEHDIVLPQSFAARHDLAIGDELELGYYLGKEPTLWRMTVVGCYRDDIALPMALCQRDALAALLPESRDNALLIEAHADAELLHLSEWLEPVYPGAVQISNYLPLRLGTSMLAQAYQPGNFILVLIFLFMGIGVLTIALMTFLERRKELATLKSIGMTNRQTVGMLGFEYGLSELVGVLLSLIVLAVMMTQISWFAEVTSAQLALMLIQGILITVIVVCLSLVYPILTAKVATVNQLLYARTIPLATSEIKCLPSPTGEQVLQEIEENVRFLRVPYLSGNDRYDCMMLKEVGQIVKQGEVVASEERSQGHFIVNYVSICDGTVIALNGPLIIIKAAEPDSPRYPYPSSLAEDARRRREMMERIRAEERELQEQGTSTLERRQKDPDGGRGETSRKQ